MKTYKKRYYMIFQTLWYLTKADFYSRMSKSKIAAKIQDGGRKFWVLSTRIFGLSNIYHHAKIRLVPKCVTDADLSCRTTLSTCKIIKLSFDCRRALDLSNSFQLSIHYHVFYCSYKFPGLRMSVINELWKSINHLWISIIHDHCGYP